MYLPSLTTLAFLTSAVLGKECWNGIVPVTISARQGTFNIPLPQQNSDVTDFARNVTQQGRNFTAMVLTGYHTTSGTYNISCQFCTPSGFEHKSSPVVQVLTHGIAFDKTYWDFPSVNSVNYSYVDVATDKYNYATLAFDRLGLGNSSHGDPLNEIQAFLEVEATAALTRMLRNGSFPGSKTAFKKVVHVGHSFGSAQTYSLANKYPTLTDGIVLTGFSLNLAAVPVFVAGSNFQLANLNQPLRFGNLTGAAVLSSLGMYTEPLAEFLNGFDFTTIAPPQNLPNGYLVSSNAEAAQLNFFITPYFDPAVAQMAEKTKQPVTYGELLTVASLPQVNSFTGPVLVIDGQNDLPFCGGDCYATNGVAAPSIPAELATSFPYVAASNFSAVVHPDTAHGLNLHYNATGAYDVINSFLASKGLKTT